MPPSSGVEFVFYPNPAALGLPPIESIKYERSRDGWDKKLDEMILAWHEENAKWKAWNQQYFNEPVAYDRKSMKSLGDFLEKERKKKFEEATSRKPLTPGTNDEDSRKVIAR